MTTFLPTDISIPASLLPADGRFGCGPSKVRPEALAGLAATGRSFLGTSHRQPTVKSLVGRLRAGLATLFDLPEGYEVVLGNGGTTVFWDIATFCLIEQRSQHLVFGEFSAKFAACATAAPHLSAPSLISSPPGTHPSPSPTADIDLYALTHNETSTGVMMPLTRPSSTGLVAVDATSGAGGLLFDPASVDAYYFAPQKCFGSDGGLWVCILSPAAVDRVRRIASSGRWVPASLVLAIALDNSALNQTYNTPALATLWLFADQVAWMLAQGGLAACSARSARSASVLYQWALASPYASPFVEDPASRSNVVGTVDLDPTVTEKAVCTALRANGIVDVESYRKLGRNQLRVGMFPSIDPDDVEALTHCIDYVVDRLS